MPDTVSCCPPAAKEACKPGCVKQKEKRTGSLLYRFIQSFDDYDTTYISPNYYNFTAMAQNTNYYQVYRLAGSDADGRTQTLYLKPAQSMKVGPYFGWRWIFLGYTFDVSHPRRLGKASEFNLSLYSSMIGLDFLYLRNAGDFRLRKAVGFEGVEPGSVKHTPFTGMQANTLTLSAYYVFNHRHFSYPAAFNQSTVQRKSCGSFMLGLGFSRQRIKMDYTKLPAELKGPAGSETVVEGLRFNNLDYNYYYVSAGYAYNWVFARNWLMGVSVMPSAGVRKIKGEKITTHEVLMDLKNLSFDCTSRLGLVWNNAHWFAGASVISHLYMYRKHRLSMTNSVNYLNIYAGFFFVRKRQYR